MKVALDLDGVLVNWEGGLCKLMNLDPFDPEVQKILSSKEYIEGHHFGTRENIDSIVNEAGYEFWMNLELLPWAYRLFDICKGYDMFFLTSHSTFPVAGHAKIDYINKYFGDQRVVITKHKYLCANENTILIDDMYHNISDWVEHGGIPFLWKCQWELLSSPQKVNDELDRLEIFLAENIQLNNNEPVPVN